MPDRFGEVYGGMFTFHSTRRMCSLDSRSLGRMYHGTKIDQGLHIPGPMSE